MSTGWGFEIVGEEGFTPLDDATVRALSALGAADVNNDGAMSRSEMEANTRRRFDAADSNRDGALDKTEIAAMRQRQRVASGN